jgi:hypothetical protein
VANLKRYLLHLVGLLIILVAALALGKKSPVFALAALAAGITLIIIAVVKSRNSQPPH